MICYETGKEFVRARFEQILALTKGKTARQTSIVYLAQVAQAVLGFALNILLIRHLDLDDYGSLTVFSSTYMLLAGLSHWGWTETYVRFGAAHREAPAVEYFFRGRIIRYAGISFLVLLAASPLLARYAYQRPAWAPLLALASLTGFLTCLASFEMNRVRLFQRFGIYFSAIVSGSAFRLAALLACFALGHLTLWPSIFVYLASPLLVIGLLWCLLPPIFSAPASPLPPEVAEGARNYNRWLLVSIFATTLITNFDMQILAFFHGTETVAQLGAASRLTLPISILVSALATTILPKLSREHQNQELMRFYLRKIGLLLPWIALGFAIAGAAAVPLLTYLAGHKYGGLELLLLLQLVSILAVLLTNPFGLVLLAKGDIKALALMNLAQLGLSLALQLALVPRWGAVGSVSAAIAVNIFGCMITMLLVSRRMKA